jgi:hypothetical protein
VKITRMSDHRARQARADALDEALDRWMSEHPDLGPELEAARRLAEDQAAIRVPTEGLVALRAAAAAQSSMRAGRVRSRLVGQGIPGAVAAVCIGIAVFAGLHRPTSPGLSGARSASAALQEITMRMASVNQQAANNNLPGVVQAAESARQSLVAAQQVAAPLPATDPIRDVLLQTADAKIAELESLLARLKLPAVASLPPVSSASGSSAQANGPTSSSTTTTSSTTTSTTAAESSTSTTGSTTSTTQGGSSNGTLAAATTNSGTSGTTTSQPTRSSSTTTSSTSSTTTTSTTPVPPPPSTTTTTAPSPPPGG